MLKRNLKPGTQNIFGKSRLSLLHTFVKYPSKGHRKFVFGKIVFSDIKSFHEKKMNQLRCFVAFADDATHTVQIKYR